MTLVELDEVAERWADVLASITEKRAFVQAPWSALRGEPRLSFLAFRAYLDNTARNTAQVAAQLSLDYDDVRDYARDMEWDRRAAMYDEYMVRQSDEARTEAMRQVALQNAQAFARLPEIVSKAQALVEGALNQHLMKQTQAVELGEEVPHLSITMAMKVADSMRALMAETNKFLGVRVDVQHTVSGTVKHTLDPSDTDALNMLRGLQDANLLPPGTVDAIEAQATG